MRPLYPPDGYKPDEVIVVDGVIGAGKTTLINKLKQYMELHQPELKVGFIEEPVHLWKSSGVLEKFYNDLTKYAFVFQIYVFTTMIQHIRSYLKENPVDILICERSIWTDRYVFLLSLKDSGHINDIEYNAYTDMWDLLEDTWNMYIGKPSLFVYLNTDIDQSLQRIHERNRDGESKISADYQLSLHKYHMDFYESYCEKEKIHHHIISGNSKIDSEEYNKNLIHLSTLVSTIISERETSEMKAFLDSK